MLPVGVFNYDVRNKISFKCHNRLNGNILPSIFAITVQPFEAEVHNTTNIYLTLIKIQNYTSVM